MFWLASEVSPPSHFKEQFFYNNMLLLYFLSLGAINLSLKTVTCMCSYYSIFSKPWAVYVSGLFEFGHWVCGESWLAIKDLQPTAPVLKAGHPMSCSTLCVLCVVCYTF